MASANSCVEISCQSKSVDPWTSWGWDRIEWFVEQDPEVWDQIIDINLKSVAFIQSSAAPGE